jgi:hypothetical protein
VCGPGGENSTYAAKKRRDASLERLRDRSPAERWRSLQKAWQPFADEQVAPSVPAPGDSPAESISAEDAGNDADETNGEFSQNNGSISESESETSAPFPIPPAPPADQERRFHAPFPQTADRSADTPSPLWVIDAGDDPTATDLKRHPGDAIMTSLQANDPPMSPSETLERQMAEAAVLKPITEILPYHDYIPGGTTDARDLLCLDGDDSTNCPIVAELPEMGFEERMFAETYVAWEPTNLFSNPLYFEDAPLERYGHTHGHLLQPFVSVGKFGVQLVGLPYQMALHPVHERRYALGWYRPGEWAPKKYYLPPWNTKAAVTAGAVYTGLIFLIP